MTLFGDAVISGLRDLTRFSLARRPIFSYPSPPLFPGSRAIRRRSSRRDETALVGVLHRWREEAGKAGHTITRIAVAFEAGRDGFSVFLGDAMQWNLRQIGDTRDVVVPVPDEAPLHAPAGFAEDQARFDRGVQALSHALQGGATPAQVERSLARIDGVAAGDAAAMTGTFVRLRELYDSGRNGIWPFILRNLMRPLWLSRPDQQADVLVANRLGWLTAT
jgi:hypothetical protein